MLRLTDATNSALDSEVVTSAEAEHELKHLGGNKTLCPVQPECGLCQPLIRIVPHDVAGKMQYSSQTAAAEVGMALKSEAVAISRGRS